MPINSSLAQRNARKVASPCRRGKVAIDIISGWLTTKRTPVYKLSGSI
ncbi:hypothetical protein H7E99_06405 [Proteus mirabilis]|nr:hypothetical protein [Proteus mirabilis]EKW9419774.1 hypothetical protein [Proteus mirabilis]EKX3823488.1 hypothetical protein [Proteus mirabilis]EKX3827017.1 hypothetical protein [Proteus mirabilis]EKX3835554.1 hypothetical protein [Proteus mirabilis]